ncbi:MAG TPA: zinc ABC transporter substrate-binding protein [Candidatus Dormibacteraeota bacterium]|jgi:zinc transport system substrate-binding protein|nr:zinc ABC transporter substrate-binding protein [Candidatus Dormibacteraeota bacterium]
MKRWAKIILVVAIIGIAVGGVYGTSRYLINQSGCQLGAPVLATFYPVYDFARHIVAGATDVSLLVPMTVDVHDFTPDACSIQQVATAKVLVYSGAGLEPWINQIVSAAHNPNLVQIDSSQGVQTITVPPEWQADGRAIDPHIWLDPVTAKQQVNNILQGLVKAFPSDNDTFTANAKSYDSQLDYLNSAIVNATNFHVTKTRYFVTFHTAFAYFAQQYNLTQIPVFGPFQDSPTAQDIQNVTNAIHQYHLCYVGYESLENPAIPQAIATNTNATLIHMNPIEGLTTADQAAGKTYIDLMYEDLHNVALALDNVGCS